MINSISDEDDPEYFPYEVFDLSRFDPMLASTVESLYSETSVWKLCLFYYDFDCNIFILHILQLPKPILKHLLIVFKWDLSKITSKYTILILILLMIVISVCKIWLSSLFEICNGLNLKNFQLIKIYYCILFTVLSRYSFVINNWTKFLFIIFG